jgi:NCS2 family nucleobase:cation symporter-2
VAPFFNTFTQSAFAQNVGLVALTKVKSRFVVTAGGFILLILGLLPVLGRVVAAIPSPVLGGAGLFLFGTVAASGIRTLAKVDYSGFNLIIVGASLAFGGLPVVSPDIYDQLPTWLSTILHSGINSAAIMAVLLNIVFNEFTRGNSKRGSVFAAAPPRMVTQEELGGLREGDVLQDGKLFDKEGNEVPVVTAEHKIAVLSQHVEECKTNSIPIPDHVETELHRTKSLRGPSLN